MGRDTRWAGVLKELHTLLHLAAWCQIGVVARVALDDLFACDTAAAAAPPASAGPGAGPHPGHETLYASSACVTTPAGALVRDFPVNIIGCFVIGLLASTDVLSKHLGRALAAPAPLAALPRRSSLQAHAAFQVGLRTGFCGSLTTFSGWMMQVRCALLALALSGRVKRSRRGQCRRGARARGARPLGAPGRNSTRLLAPPRRRLPAAGRVALRRRPAIGAPAVGHRAVCAFRQPQRLHDGACDGPARVPSGLPAVSGRAARCTGWGECQGLAAGGCGCRPQFGALPTRGAPCPQPQAEPWCRRGLGGA